MESSNIPPPPPPPVKGQLPPTKLPTQLPEAPACVQNAMMTKDKKPFTYTPGGIDLSQIKSPRMAKRVQKNAMSEGVSGPPKISSLAQSNQTQPPTQSPSEMGAFAVGMPFQVLPPAKPQSQPQTSKSSTNESTHNYDETSYLKLAPKELRPEIKIPQNPMAQLKSAPCSKPQDDFWAEENKQGKLDPKVSDAAEVLQTEVPQQSIPQRRPTTQKPITLQHETIATPLSNLYIPNPAQEDKNNLLSQLSPPWMSTKSINMQTPEWAHRNESEKVIPVQGEQRPITPLTANISPQPFYGTSPMATGYDLSYFASPQPSISQYTPQYNNPNQYVSQGYQNVDYNRQQLLSPTPSGTRVIPMRIECTPSPAPEYCTPLVQSPVIAQRDPRTFSSQQISQTLWGNNSTTTPTQSRSFKILQKITDSYTDGSESDNTETHQTFAETDSRMRQLKFTNDDQKLMCSIKNQGASKPYVPPSEQCGQAYEPKKYTGANIPSRSFRLLQAMTQPENAVEFADYFQQIPDPTSFPYPFPLYSPFMNPYFLMPAPYQFYDKNTDGNVTPEHNTEKCESNENCNTKHTKPQLTDEVLSDLNRLKDMEIIDLLDDTTKSILDSLRELHSQYGIHFDETEEGSRNAATLLNPEYKASICSSLSNILRRDLSTNSIPTSEKNKETDEEKLNLLRSLTNLLKAEKGIRSRLNSVSGSRSRVNSCSERSGTKTDEETPRASPLPEDNEHEEMKQMVEEQVEGEDVNFWDILNKDDDDFKPPKRTWMYRNTYSVVEEQAEDCDTEKECDGDADDEAEEEKETSNKGDESTVSVRLGNDNNDKAEEYKNKKGATNCAKKPIKIDASIMTDAEQTDDEGSRARYEDKSRENKDIAEQYHKMIQQMWANGFFQNVWPNMNMYYSPGYPPPMRSFRETSPFQQQFHAYHYPLNYYPQNYSQTLEPHIHAENNYQHQFNGYRQTRKENWNNGIEDGYSEREEDKIQMNDRDRRESNQCNNYQYLQNKAQNYQKQNEEFHDDIQDSMVYNELNSKPNKVDLEGCFLRQRPKVDEQDTKELQTVNNKGDKQVLLTNYNCRDKEETLTMNYSNNNNCDEHSHKNDNNRAGTIPLLKENSSTDVTNSFFCIQQASHDGNYNNETIKNESAYTFLQRTVNIEEDESTREELISPPSIYKESSEEQSISTKTEIVNELIVTDHSKAVKGEIIEGKILIIPSNISNENSQIEEEVFSRDKMIKADQTTNQVVIYQIEDELSDEEQTYKQDMSAIVCEDEQEKQNNIAFADEEPENHLIYKNSIAEHLPHQLSIIFEVTEHSDKGSIRSSSFDSSDDNNCQTDQTSETEEENTQNCDSVKDISVNLSIKLRNGTDIDSSADKQRTAYNTTIADSDHEDVSVSVHFPLKRFPTNEAIDKCASEPPEDCDGSDNETNIINSNPVGTKKNILAKRSASVPPKMDSEADEALQKRLQILRDQWGQIAREVNKKPTEAAENTSYKWNIMFFEAIPNKDEEEKIRRKRNIAQFVTFHKWSPPKLQIPQQLISPILYQSQISFIKKNSSQKEIVMHEKRPEPQYEDNWEPNSRTNEIVAGENSHENGHQKLVISNINTTESDGSILERDWYSTRECKQRQAVGNPNSDRIKCEQIDQRRNIWENKKQWRKNTVSNDFRDSHDKSLRYRMIEVQALDSSDTESESEKSQSEYSEHSDFETSSSKLSPQLAKSLSPLFVTSHSESTYTASYRLSRSKSRLSSRPSSCTQEIERVKGVSTEAESANIKYVGASSICCESPYEDRSMRPPELFVQNSIKQYSSAENLECPIDVTTSTYTPELRSHSCTSDVEQQVFKTSTIRRQLSLNVEDVNVKPSWVRNGTTELNIVPIPSSPMENPPKEEIENVIVRRRPKKGRARPVSAVGNLENCRHSLEGSMLETMISSYDSTKLETVVEINHVPSRSSSCTKEIETYWSGRQREKNRAHSVTREIILSPNSTPAEILGERLLSVRDRVAAFESFEACAPTLKPKKKILSVKSSIDESDYADDDSGVQSSKCDSELGTDMEGFSELRKMLPYQRANTQTKLFQYLQGCNKVNEEEESLEENPKNIIHNTFAIREQHSELIKDVETIEQRRQKLSLPLVHQHSSGIESFESSLASPSSPIREKLAGELVHSLLINKDGIQFKNIPLEKLHAAALKILHEEEALNRVPSTSTINSTPALTPSDFQADSPSYESYHASFQAPCDDEYDYNMFPSKAFKKVHDQVCRSRRGSLKRSPSTTTNVSLSNPHSHSPSPFRTLPTHPVSTTSPNNDH